MLNVKRLIPTPQGAIKGLARQVAGVVILGAAGKYVPNVWARWGIYVVGAAYGIWYPITRALLTVTHLDDTIENI